MGFYAAKPIENRRFGRRETCCAAWIKIDGRPRQPCIVRNISQGGALLACDHPRSLPYQFELVIEATNARYVCEARHCTDETIGVEFRQAELTEAPPASRAAPKAHAADWSGHQPRERTVRNVSSSIEAMKAHPSKR